MNADPLDEVKWYAVRSRRFREALGASSVRALGLEVFLPLIKCETQQHSPIKLSFKPLFSGYFFARFAASAMLDSVAGARGVFHVVKCGNHPASLEDGAIEEIKGRVQEDGFIRLKPQRFSPGETVSIQEGPFAGMMGRVETELDDGRRVAILLAALWGARVLVEKEFLEAKAA